MGIETIIAGIGVAATVGGAAVSYEGSRAAASATADQTAASQSAENARRAQMELEAQRKQRDIIRQSQIARATATTNAGASGDLQTSGYAGGISQVAGEQAYQVSGVNQSLKYGEQIFDANAAYGQASLRLAQANSTSALGKSIGALGSSMIGNAGTIDKIGTTLFSGGSPATTTGGFGLYGAIGPAAKSPSYYDRF